MTATPLPATLIRTALRVAHIAFRSVCLMVRLALLLLALVATGLLAACSDDYGTACDLPDTPDIRAACLPDDGDGPATTPTCVITVSAQCSSRVCAVHRGSSPFCSKRCESSADCPGEDTCERTSSATGPRYCVPAELR